MLTADLPPANETEGPMVPEGLPPIVDAHVHVFPHGIFEALWEWFKQNAWPVRYQLGTTQIFDYLLSRGVRHLIALQYAHKPGMAAALNRYMALKCARYPGRVTGLATVFPGEEGAEAILEEAFAAGLGGLKLHAHVQCFDMNSEPMDRLYQLCAAHRKPIVMHVGREPKSPAYLCDPYAICAADKLERILVNFPDLKICVPHLGFDEITAYRALTEKYDHLWLDTTMVLADFFPLPETIDLTCYRLDRIMYGTDFPNIPYAWDRELKYFKKCAVSDEGLEWILGKSAAQFFNLTL